MQIYDFSGKGQAVIGKSFCYSGEKFLPFDEKVSIPRRKCFYYWENFSFLSLKLKFTSLKFKFTSLEHKFQSWKQKILLREKTFSPRSKKIYP